MSWLIKNIIKDLVSTDNEKQPEPSQSTASPIPVNTAQPEQLLLSLNPTFDKPRQVQFSTDLHQSAVQDLHHLQSQYNHNESQILRLTHQNETYKR